MTANPCPSERRALNLALQGGGQASGQPGIGKAVAQGVAGAAVMGAGFHLGGQLVGGILDALFNRRA